MDVLELRDIFEYDPQSPSGLKWRKKVSRKVKIGAFAGSANKINKNQFRYNVCVKGGMMKCSRVVYTLLRGEIPEGMVIDHIDGNPSNNLIENLRAVPSKVNSRNVGLRKDNNTGKVGVSLGNCRGNMYYKSRWTDLKGKRVVKCFSIKKYGEELARFLAEETRELAIIRMNLKGAGYTDRHGLNFIKMAV